MDVSLQLVARTTDGETLVVEQIPDAADHQHLMVLVVAAVSPPSWAQLVNSCSQ